MVLRILLLSDGRPGHFRQSESIAAALSRRREVQIERLELAPRLPRWLIGRAFAVLPARTFLSLVHGIRPKGLAADLVVSAGAATLGANAAIAAVLGIANVFAGSPRSIGAGRMALVLTPYAKEAGRQNTAYELKPSTVDPDRLPDPPDWGTRPERPALSLLLGGPTGETRFRGEDWRALARLVASLARDWQARWTIVSSRRTPRAAYDALLPLAENPAVRFVDYRTAGVGSIAPTLAADAVFVTSDSLSMISEGVAARRPVIVLAPRRTRPTADAQAVGDLQDAGHLAVLAIAAASPETIAMALKHVRPMAANHLDLLAETLVSRLAL